ncbi:MAG: flagellar FlbD family protein [bacterium]|nr:flagellar FlbD family protein [bacterium]
MVKVTRFNGSQFYISAHQLETLEATPDTVITLLSGRKYIVVESIDEIIDRIVEYRRRLVLWGNEDENPPVEDKEYAEE